MRDGSHRARPIPVSPSILSLRDITARLTKNRDSLCRGGLIIFKNGGKCVLIANGTVEFSPSDAAFIEKFGILQATDMVLDFAATNRHPFLYDTYQLADFLLLRRAKLFQMVRHVDRYYTERALPKRNGGVRVIAAPYGELKMVQWRILHFVIRFFPVSPYATAYKEGCGLRSNAAPHRGKRYLLKLDLEDFFGSIPFQKVYQAAFGQERFPKQIGVMLTTLCCRNDVLPQGAPTSPALSNLVLRWFDDTIGEWCRKRGVSYTRYSDDLTFSADRPLYDVYQKVTALLEQRGFVVNEKKTRFITNASRMEVTGLTVNNGVGVSAAYKRKLRQEVYCALKYGVEDAAARVGFSGTPLNYANHLLGRMQFVLQFDRDNKWFQQAKEEMKERIRYEVVFDPSR